jgi:predicted 3-demethylubiquinone-9 3-methyltransferase (glyoxalase superfamily)
MQKIITHLWFDKNAEEAAQYYVEVFNGSPNKAIDSKITETAYYPKAGQDVHGMAPGTVMTVVFELDDQTYMGLNGGPHFKFNEAISLLVNCQDQDEVDYFWQKLSAVPEAEQCGWCKDRFGLSWQIVPVEMDKIMNDPDTAKVERAMTAMLKMKKLDISELKKAAEGK